MIWWLYYLFASFLVGVFGINKRFGFWGYFFGSLLLSPLVGVILLFASDSKKKLKT